MNVGIPRNMQYRVLVEIDGEETWSPWRVAERAVVVSVEIA
jgi:hypothetical protein